MTFATDNVKDRRDADGWAARLLAVVGAAGGGSLGMLYAPDIQSDLGLLGISSYTRGPGVVIVTIAASLGAILAWRAARWR